MPLFNRLASLALSSIVIASYVPTSSASVGDILTHSSPITTCGTLISPDVSIHLAFSPDSIGGGVGDSIIFGSARSEEHTSELQSRGHIVCRLLLEKRKKMYQVE